jgi:hypothetical protein
MAPGKVLLIFDALVQGEEDLHVGCFRQRKQLSVTATGETRLRNRETFAVWKIVLEFSRKALIQQKFFHSSLRSSAFACSRASTAA